MNGPTKKDQQKTRYFIRLPEMAGYEPSNLGW